MAKTLKKRKQLDGELGKKFIKENKKIIKVIIIVSIILLLSFFGYRAWLNIHFFITDDLVLSLEPQDKSISILYGEKPNVSISVDIENSFVCDAFCSYEFKDLSTETLVDKGVFTSKGIGKKFKKNFKLSVERSGSGQKIYTFEIRCNNIRTWHCLTNEDKRKRTSFITLNYDISEYEKFLKSTLKENITKLVNELSAIDINVQELNNRIFELGFSVNLNEIFQEKEILNNDYDKIVLEFKNLERIWSEQDYVLLSELFNKSYDSRITSVKLRISDISSKVDEIIKKHNLLIDEFDKIDSNLRTENETIIFLNRFNNNILEKHRSILEKIEKVKIKIKENSFSDYSFLEGELEDVKRSFEDFEKESMEVFMDVYLKGSYHYSLEKEKLCKIKGICTNKTDFPKAIINSVSIDDNKILDVCLEFAKVKEINGNENDKSKELMKNYNFDEMNDILENAKKIKILTVKKNLFDEIKNVNESKSTGKALNVLLNIANTSFTDEKIDYGDYSESEILALIEINLLEDSEQYYGDYCGTKEMLNILEYYGNKTLLSRVRGVELGNFTSRVEIELTENYPICCVFGKCKRCCTDEECKKDESLYPILFLHGHALNSDNSPDYSLDAFNRIQAKLQEDGYIGVGTITPISDYSEINQGEWGLLSKPISVKGSYYRVSYYNLGSYAISTQKSESIETYAIRLKELIDLLKFRTGRDKVVIVAHSMGGLVARSYLQIFGEEDVDKIIMITTPNKGVSGSVSSYCPILGEKKECNDMSEESIFIKKINDPNKVPKNVEVHNIVGMGCDTDGENGDGVVSKENSELEYAENYYVNGTCGSFSVLHTQILDIEKYPKVYETISSILRKS
jgi:hypothetical protein